MAIDFQPTKKGGAIDFQPTQAPTPKTAPAPFGKTYTFNQPSLGSQIGSAFQGGVDKANAAAQETSKATNVAGKLVGLLHFGSGVASAVSAPVAPFYNATFGQAVDRVGDKISDIPAVQKFSQTTAGETTSRVAETLADAGNIAGTVLGAKGMIDSAPKVLSGARDMLTPTPKTAAAPKQPALVTKRVNELTKLEANSAPIRRVTQKHAAQGIDSKQILAQTDLLHGSVDDTGTIRTANARAELDHFIKPQEKVISDTIAREGVTLKPKQIEEYLRATIDKSGLEGANLEAAHAKIDAEMKGLQRRADSSGNIPLAKVYDAKVNKYSTIDYLNPGSKIADKAIARGLKELTQQHTKSADVQALSRELQQHYSVLDLLEKLDGKKVEGGRLGKYFAQGVGAVVGGHFGPLGSIAGAEIAGRMKGAAMAKKLSGKTGANLEQSPAMQAAIERNKQGPLGLPAPKEGTPKVQNNVPIPMRGVAADEPAYRSNSLGNRNQSQSPTTITKSTTGIENKSGTQTQPLGGAKSSPSLKDTIVEKGKAVIKDIKENGNKGFVRNPFGAAAKKLPAIHADDLATMRDITDYVGNDYKPSASEAQRLELDASRLWEHYFPNEKMPKTLRGVANAFGVVLEAKGFLSEQPRDPLGRFDKKKVVSAPDKAPLGTTKQNITNGDKPAPLGKNGAWPTTASKQSKAGSTSTGNAPTGKEGVSAQKAGTSVPFEGVKLYHGTKAEFTDFDIKKTGASSDPGLLGDAVYFSPSKEQALDYANNPRYGKGTTPRVIEANVSLKNPLIIIDGKLPDGRGLSSIHPNGITKTSAKAISDEMKAAGYDGAIFKNSDGEVTQVAVFDTKAIKSSPSIPKELEPLAAEARKYKSAEEFVKENYRPAYDFADKPGLTPFIEAAKRSKSFAEFARGTLDIPIEAVQPNTALGVIKPGESRTPAEPVRVSPPSQAYGEHFVIQDGVHRYASALRRGDKTIRVKFEPNSFLGKGYWARLQDFYAAARGTQMDKSQLTDFYNKVKGGK